MGANIRWQINWVASDTKPAKISCWVFCEGCHSARASPLPSSGPAVLPCLLCIKGLIHQSRSVIAHRQSMAILIAIPVMVVIHRVAWTLASFRCFTFCIRYLVCSVTFTMHRVSVTGFKEYVQSPQLKWPSPRSDLFSVYRTNF